MSGRSSSRGPPNGEPPQRVNGYTGSNPPYADTTARGSWPGSQMGKNGMKGVNGTNGTNGGGAAPPRYPHLKDLQARGETELTLSVHSSIDALLDRARQSTKQVITDVSFKRPDRAYIEWLIASEILLNIVPIHRDYPYLNRDRKALYSSLCKQIDSQHSMIKGIHDMIVEDNQRSGIQSSVRRQSSDAKSMPRDGDRQAQQLSPRPLSMPETSDYYNPEQRSSGYSTDTRFSNNTSNYDSRDSSPARPSSQQSRQRPIVHPKPDRMHAPLSSSSGAGATSADLLAERFAQLRAPSIAPKVVPPYPLDDSPMNIPSRQYSGRSSVDSTQPPPPYQESKPLGPRPLPPPPSIPPKLPLNTQLASSLPRAPSPTYSPARNLASPSSVVPPRTSARSMVGTGGRSSQQIPDTQYNSAAGGQGYQSSVAEQYQIIDEGKRRFQDLPNPSAITAQELSDRFRSHNILLIDVRSRQEFDDGHIFAKAIMCIEPLSLKYGIPAEELEESLVVSPEAEQSLFERRNEFDLIVYYDQKTSSNRFLDGPPNGTYAPALRALHDTLYEFNYYKELQRPPAVLLGGLDAWTDLVGYQALQTSRTAALIGNGRPRRLTKGSGRQIGRVPMASANSSREIRMRRLREYNPLDADEEKAWREKARTEQVEAADIEQSQSDGDDDSATSHLDEEPSPLIHSYEDFLRKFPEPQAIQQSMVGARYGPPPPPPPPHRAPPELPAILSIPSRPPPAVPRPSYSGVSERDSSLNATTSRQPSSAQTPLYTSRSITHYLKLPRTGLINFGVTCYMNATIQCLLATIPLSQFFLDNRWRNYTQKNWKGSNGIMPDIFANLIRSLWRNDVQAVRPSSLRKFCTRLNSEWGIDRQQDAKEFFDFLVDCLHEDLNIHWQRNPLRPLTPEEEAVRERMPLNKVSKTEWDRYCHRESSYISDLFAGQHASRLRCKTCGNTSTTYEAFYSISVEIPRSGRGDIRECLRSYCQEEMLSGEEEWKCPYCKCEREATKRITLTRLPQVLVIHFKRFSASKTESARKVHTPIDFPLHGLTMEPYMANTRMDPSSGDDISDPATTPPFQYDAYAVMRHLGQTGNGGHYISLVRDAARGCWRKFDDERATDFDPNKLRPDQRLQNEQAYIVFYGRSAAR